MPQEIAKHHPLSYLSSASLIRLAGLGLLVFLMIRLDLEQVYEVLRAADLPLVILSISGIIPLILVKTVRWQGIMRSQAIQLATWPALLAYFGSLFIGFLTPGRLGEFIKAVHVNRDCGVSLGQAFSSVLADRLFDLYTLFLVGSAALLSMALGEGELIVLAGFVLLFTVPLGLFLNDITFTWFQRFGLRFGALGRKLLAPKGILPEVRAGMRQLTWRSLLVAVVLTLLAYGIFFGQCYLLARALGLSAELVPVTFAVALGSLVTLIPVSISGLGTREAAMIAYLNSVGVQAEAALSFSLLVFVTFYIAGGLIGAVAWWIKPVPINDSSRQMGDAL